MRKVNGLMTAGSRNMRFREGNTRVLSEISFDWEREFKRHMDAVKVMRRYTDLGESYSNQTDSNQTVEVRVRGN
jgi:hypothetical protein